MELEGLEDLEGDGCAGFGVGQGVVMLGEVEAAGGSYGVEFMVGETEGAAGGCECAEKRILRVWHLVGLEYGAEASLVKGTIVSYKRKVFDLMCDFGPHLREMWCGVGVAASHAMYTSGEGGVVIGCGANETVELFHHLSVAYYHDAHAAYTGARAIGCLEIYSCKIFHTVLENCECKFNKYFTEG